MVKICSNIYPLSNNKKYKEYFDKYSFPLSSFQKFAIEAIVEENHILITAHTGSGKTLPAEFAIEYFVQKGKKVIYTTPIKALSNQKFYDFSKKFPHISFGLLTGDIKCNPEADVLIMTSEILLNKLYQTFNENLSQSFNSFEMNINTELGAVVMDEVHYINDSERGKVWEQTIMMLPLNIQMIMLSATLDSPEKFALWCENKGNPNLKINKIVYLTTTHERIVPLKHYSFITVTNGIFKVVKDKSIQQEIKNTINKTHLIIDSKGEFNDKYYQNMNNLFKLFSNKNIIVKRQNVLNQVSKFMVDNQMLPALCFVFSRKNLEICAKEITVNLLEFDSKVPYIIKNECEQIIRKLPNYQEYLQLPEYLQLVSLLEKGIAIHHAGIIPIFREMVELLYAKGYIKLLFATETFAVGINMPTKTVLFSSLEKWDGHYMRYLFAHEYTQMAGRAGRRGIDEIGYVIHLNNLFKTIDLSNYKTIMKGNPQKLLSQFRISYNLILNLIKMNDQKFTQFAKKSMIQENIDCNTQILYYKLNDLQSKQSHYETILDDGKIPFQIYNDFLNLLNQQTNSVNSKKKEINNKLSIILDNYPKIMAKKETLIKYNITKDEINIIQFKINKNENFIDENIKNVLNILIENKFINYGEMGYSLTLKGNIASNLQEIHCLIFSELIELNKLNNLNFKELVAIFSCFTNISIPEDNRILAPPPKFEKITSIMMEIVKKQKLYQDLENKFQINTGIDDKFHYDLIEYVIQWIDCKNSNDCKILLKQIEFEKDIFLGEFVKALLKINTITLEMEKIVEEIGNIELLNKLKEISPKILKYVVTNQSLYI